MTQIPCGEISVTSIAEVPIPCDCELISAGLDDFLNLPKLRGRILVILRQNDGGFKPELCLPVGGPHVHVHPGFLKGKEEESITALAKYRRALCALKRDCCNYEPQQ
jgi:hypothetical protein